MNAKTATITVADSLSEKAKSGVVCNVKKPKVRPYVSLGLLGIKVPFILRIFLR